MAFGLELQKLPNLGKGDLDSLFASEISDDLAVVGRTGQHVGADGGPFFSMPEPGREAIAEGGDLYRGLGKESLAGDEADLSTFLGNGAQDAHGAGGRSAVWLASQRSAKLFLELCVGQPGEQVDSQPEHVAGKPNELPHCPTEHVVFFF